MNTLEKTSLILPELAEHHDAVEDLQAEAFGPGRFARAAFRIREQAPHRPELSYVAFMDGLLIGSVRMTVIEVGAEEGLLLGPLVVHPDHKNRGAGRALVAKACMAAAAAGYDFVLLVGDQPYYGPLGFAPVEPSKAVTLPGPVDPARTLVRFLSDRRPALAGMIRGRPPQT